MRNPDTQLYNTVSELVDLTTSQTYPIGSTTSSGNFEQWIVQPQTISASPWTDAFPWTHAPEGSSGMSGTTTTGMSQDEFEERVSRQDAPEIALESMRGTGLSIYGIDFNRPFNRPFTRLIITLNNGYDFAEELDDRELIKFEHRSHRAPGDFRGMDVDQLIDILRDIRGQSSSPQKSFTQIFINNMYNEKSIKEN